MDLLTTDLMTIEARLDTPSASIELQRINLPGEIDRDLPAVDGYRIDFSVTPRTPGARLSFQGRWPAHRFESPGRIYMVPPGEPVRARSGAGTQEAVICLLKPAMLDDWLEAGGGGIGRNLDAGLDIRNATLRRVMAALGAELRHPGFASAAMCEALSMQIAVELGRYYLAWDKAGSAAAALAGWRLALIDDRLAAPGAPPTLAELAGLCGLSTRHLTRGFRVSRGCSIGSYVRNHQIETAKRSLAEGICVKTIAHRLGFSSRSSFSHAFQKITGLAPQQFRRDERAARRREMS